MMNKTYYLIFILFIGFNLSTYGQIGEGGLPPSFFQSVNMRSVNSIDTIPNFEALIDFNVDKLIREDSISLENHNSSRAAKSIPLNLNIDSTGVWNQVNNLNVWQQSISAKGAKGIILSYKDFYIPIGGKLFIYNADKSQVLGGYNHDTNPNGGLFATEMITGESITLEYVGSSISEEKPRIIIDDLGYVYDERSLIYSEINLRSRPNSPSTILCAININCPDGNLWKKQKRGVIMLTIKRNDNSWVYCSGSLVNNTAEDGKPLVLTASHCFENGGIPEQSIFYFNYENEGCTNGNRIDPPTTKTLVGAVNLMQSPIDKGGDGYLMNLNTNVPEEWHPYYNGWDIRNVTANSGVVIHHPNGDLKKITTFVTPLTTYTYKDDGNNTGATNAHWRVVYDGNSVTQGGSSGSPIFNENGLIVGALSGGASTCVKRYDPDLFAKLWYNWDQYAFDTKNSTQKMQPYLDPLNKGAQTLQGFDPNVPTGIEDEIIEDSKELVIFPNPAEHELNINTSSIIKSLAIHDLSGRLIFHNKNYNSSTMTLPISTWKSGVYTITIQTELGKLSDKFIKK